MYIYTYIYICLHVIVYESVLACMTVNVCVWLRTVVCVWLGMHASMNGWMDGWMGG